MAGVGLLLLGLILAVILQKALKKSAYTRERPPLVPQQHQSQLASYPPNSSYMFDMVPDTVGSSHSVKLKAFTMHMEEVIESKVIEDDVFPVGETGVVTVSGLYSQNPLQRSVSQLIDSKDEDPWEPHFRRLDSGLFEGEEFVDTIKGFSTVRKEHTMFTDTNL
ncbi:usherin isoform X2 [Paramisgurnus dabryanus]